MERLTTSRHIAAVGVLCAVALCLIPAAPAHARSFAGTLEVTPGAQSTSDRSVPISANIAVSQECAESDPQYSFPCDYVVLVATVPEIFPCPERGFESERWRTFFSDTPPGQPRTVTASWTDYADGPAHLNRACLYVANESLNELLAEVSYEVPEEKTVPPDEGQPPGPGFVDRDCSDFTYWEDAQPYLLPGDPHDLDRDNDGSACDTLPRRPISALVTAPVSPANQAQPRAPRRPTRRYRGRVIRVIDGDTLKIRLRSGARRTVRLVGIDTPESRKPGVPVECGARGATSYMRKLTMRRGSRRSSGQQVRVTTDPTQGRTDRYGRLLAYVTRVSDGTDVGAAMIRAGWAKPYVDDEKPFKRLAPYEARRRQAETGARGVWASCAGDFHSRQPGA